MLYVKNNILQMSTIFLFTNISFNFLVATLHRPKKHIFLKYFIILFGFIINGFFQYYVWKIPQMSTIFLFTHTGSFKKPSVAIFTKKKKTATSADVKLTANVRKSWVYPSVSNRYDVFSAKRRRAGDFKTGQFARKKSAGSSRRIETRAAIRSRIAPLAGETDKWRASSRRRCGCIISACIVTPDCINIAV